MQIFSYFLSAFAYLILICCFLLFKLKIKQKLVLFTILLINILLMGVFLGNAGVVLLIISVCTYIAFIDSHRLINICTIVAAYLFGVVVENMYSIAWDTWISPLYSATDLQSSFIYLIYILSYIVLLACICPVLSRLLRPVFHGLQAVFSGQLLLLIAANLFACLFAFLFNIIMGDSIGYTREIVVFNCILFICYFSISTVLIVNITKAHIAKADMDMRQDSYNKLQEYTNQIERMYSSLRSFKHDYSNIMLSMSGYIEADDMDGLKEYFEKEILPTGRNISKNTAHINQLMNIKVPELKSIISAKLLYAIELNISVSIEVTDEAADMPMDTLDMARVIGIFLDNAIEAALETDAPFISFALIHLDTDYVFIISNSFLDKGVPYASLAQPNVSTKGGNRGLGLYNAHEIIAKYNSVFLDTEIQEGTFVQRLRMGTVKK